MKQAQSLTLNVWCLFPLCWIRPTSSVQTGDLQRVGNIKQHDITHYKISATSAAPLVPLTSVLGGETLSSASENEKWDSK